MAVMVQGHPVMIANWRGITSYQDLVASYRVWVPMVTEIHQIEDELKRLKETQREIRGLNPTRKEFLTRLKASYQKYEARGEQRIARFLSESIRSSDPLSRLEKLDFYAGPVIPWDTFQRSAEMVPEGVFGEVADKQRGAELEKIDKRKEELELRLTELKPPPYLKTDHLGDLRDTRMMFVGEWQRKQREAREPVSILGIDLKASDADERWAYSELGIAHYINRANGDLAAAPY